MQGKDDVLVTLPPYDMLPASILSLSFLSKSKTQSPVFCFMNRDEWNPERSAGACFHHSSSNSASAITYIDHKWLLSPYPMLKSAVNSSCSLKRTHSQRENIFSIKKEKKKVEGGQHIYIFFLLLFLHSSCWKCSSQSIAFFLPL